jgi:hypothetical protein
MDHRGLRARLTGAGCTSCGTAIPADGIDVLADRGDVAFVELSCPACASRSVSLVLGHDPGGGSPLLDTAAHPEMDPATEARLAGRPPVSWDDVRAMGSLLAGWTGDLRSLVGEPGPTRVRRDE